MTALAAPVLQSPLRIGSNQFAYCKEKGSRDALAYLVLSIISSFEQRQKVVLFCSDVQGAFDRVSEERFAYKVAKAGLPDALIPVFISWMQRRRAKVVCDGAQSDGLELRDMVFQGTVWGPPLWNLFFGDSERPVHKTGFEPIVYADDLNAIKVLDSDIENEQALLEGRRCQEELHRWGRANGVSFDPGKESLHVLSRTDPAGEPFKILGVSFDLKLIMGEALHSLAAEASWRIRTILRARRFHTTAEMIHLYKAQVLSYVEYRTVAIYHACDTHLAHIDRLQTRFLRELDVSPEEALTEFHLAPLSTRRDIAMLGMVHRASLGKGPRQLHRFFCRDENFSRRPTRAGIRLHDRQLREHRTGCYSELLSRSALGLVSVYNLLPQVIIESSEVKLFQSRLQHIVKYQASVGSDGWSRILSPRLALHSHPVRRL